MQTLVGVVMGSKSDWDTMMHAVQALHQMEVPYKASIVSAHRTPDELFNYAQEAEKQGLEIIIAGAGGAAHLPGMLASKTVIPVLGVPVQSKALNGMDSLLSIVQMPKGVPVGTLAIGEAGAFNAGILAAQFIGSNYPHIRENVRKYRAWQAAKVAEESENIQSDIALATSIVDFNRSRNK